ncbi:hypothetical protein [Halobaculum marinum]|uniref:Uncharacterized protein n=1 Tax=Halobaculum marinum TaxID=3031996 RepID=A0ABD5X2G4_9EURY|nr:hypothetical protein [Halobaculum sp. DT55]
MAVESDDSGGITAVGGAVRRLFARLASVIPSVSDADETLSPDEAIRRAHALGVAAAFGADTETALEEVRTSLDATYDRSIVDLAYREGKGDAEGYERGDATSTDAETLRSRLAQGGSAETAAGPESGVDGTPTPAGIRPTATDLPATLQRAGLLEGGENLEALGFPEGLGNPTDNEGSNL